jgi:hypothetical protein
MRAKPREDQPLRGFLGFRGLALPALVPPALVPPALVLVGLPGFGRDARASCFASASSRA